MISEEFKKNVESGDVVTVRSALVDYLIIDRSFNTFDEALTYAKQKLDLIQPYDNNEFVSDSTQWNEAYLNEQKVALMVNFSSERISHVKDVISAIMPPASNTTPRVPNTNGSTGKRTGQKTVSETEVISSHHSSQTNSRNESQGRKTSRTGKRRTVTREIPSDSQGKAKVEEGVGVGMIITGAAVATVGAVAEVPILIGTGVVVAVAGVGVAMKGKG